MKKVFLALAPLLLLVFLFPKTVEAGRGCCSYHGGQSYCDTSVGRWVCNDGTYSPTCGCTYIAPKPAYVAPIKTIAPVVSTPRPTVKPTPTETPTETPTIAPTATPQVEGASVEVTPSPTPAPTSGSTSDTLIGLGAVGLFGFIGWKALKWLGAKAGQKNPTEEV